MKDYSTLISNPIFLKMQSSNQSIGLITGVFDLLHQGHLHFLKKAKEEMSEIGGYLIIGIESDVRVKQLKGDDRPINNQDTRLKNLVETDFADLVFVLPQNFSEAGVRMELLRQVQPKFLVVSESTPNLEKKQEMMSKIGGVVKVVCAHDPNYSTTKILSKR